MEPVQPMQPNRTMPNDQNDAPATTKPANNDPAQPVWIPIGPVSSGESI
jgi:hypothetical protein